MFDIADYYKNHETYNSNNLTLSIEDIEDDIIFDIADLQDNYINKLYLKDKFKTNSFDIDIIFPKISHPVSKSLFRGPDYIRFLLSLYPYRLELNKIDSIILRPRYIEINNTELLSLFIRKEKILIIYLHHPHLYNVNDFKFYEHSDQISLCMPNHIYRELSSTNVIYDTKKIKKIPPLWRLISTITISDDNKIDKFLIKRDNKNSIITRKLAELSFLYSRDGY